MSLAITKISPIGAVRGATGTVITITGTGFGATQDTSTLKIGAVAVIAAGWGDTSITCEADDSPATPLGAQDVEIVVGGVTVTVEDSIYIRDTTEEFDPDELIGGFLNRVYIDGLHVGYLSGDMDIGTTDTALDYQPNNLRGPVKTLITKRVGEIKFNLGQPNGANLGMALGGTWDSTNKRVTVSGSRTVAEHSVLVEDKKDSDGTVRNSYFIPRCQVVAPTHIVLNPEKYLELPVTLRALAVDDDTGLIFRADLP